MVGRSESAARRFEDIRDTVIAVPSLDAREREYLSGVLDDPDDDYKALVVALDAEGCKFPLTQAAMMLPNTPGVARKIIEAHRGT